MADWTSIPDSAIDPDAPITSELAYAWRDNPIAIAEGAPGAPKVTYSAILGPVAGTANTLVSNTVTVLASATSSVSIFSVSILNGGTVTVSTNATTMSGGPSSVLQVVRRRNGNNTVIASYTTTGSRVDNVPVSRGDIVTLSLGFPSSGQNVASGSMSYGNDGTVGVVTLMQ